MTKRETYIKAMRNEKVDELVWAPNFDYWLDYNTRAGTLPSKYENFSRNDIVRAVGGSIWHRTSGADIHYDKNIKFRNLTEGKKKITIAETPLGTLSQAYVPSEDEYSTPFMSEHFVKDVKDLKTLKYIVEGTNFTANNTMPREAKKSVGEDGIVLSQSFCVPFVQFAKLDVGYINAFYMWNDYKDEVDDYLSALSEKFLRGYGALAQCDFDVISTEDNMDGYTISPPIFKEYGIPFYRQVKEILQKKNIIFEGHWCGRTSNLLELVPESGLDIVEAIVTKPMDVNMSITQALEKLGGKVVMQGGIPAVMVCKEGASMDEFKKYINEVILPLKGRKGFILGMSDNVPPNADFERIEMISELIQ